MTQINLYTLLLRFSCFLSLVLLLMFLVMLFANIDIHYLIWRIIIIIIIRFLRDNDTWCIELRAFLLFDKFDLLLKLLIESVLSCHNSVLFWVLLRWKGHWAMVNNTRGDWGLDLLEKGRGGSSQEIYLVWDQVAKFEHKFLVALLLMHSLSSFHPLCDKCMSSI